MSRSSCSGRGISRLTGKAASDHPGVNVLRPVIVELNPWEPRARRRGKRRGYKRTLRSSRG